MGMNEEMDSNYLSFVGRVLDVEENPRSEFLPLEGYQNQSVVLINAAIQRLSGTLPSISHDLSIARERTSKVSTDNLNEEEWTALYLYTMGTMSSSQTLHEGLNDALRAKKQGMLNPYLCFLKIFIMALSKLESVSQTIYRGIKTDLSDSYSVGKTFVWSGFSSCLASGQILSSEQFLGATGPRTFFKINCSNGKNIRQYSSVSSAEEILLLPGTKFKVISIISPSTDLHIIEIQEILSSSLLRQCTPSISNEINEFRFNEKSLENINPDMINALNHSNKVLKKIEEQRLKDEGEFSAMKLNDESVILIADEIKTNTNWRMLKLHNNKIGNAGMPHLSSALVLNSTLTTLFLNDNFLGDYAIRLLTDALRQNFTLTTLALCENEIKEAGAKSLALLLRTNSTLTELSLDGNMIRDDGMIALCETLEQYNRSLKILWVNDNHISDRSVDPIVAFRSMNHVLDDFRFDANRFSKQAMNTLQAGTKKHEEIVKSLSSINEVAVVYLELKCMAEKQLSRDAAFMFTNFCRLPNAKAFENFMTTQMNNTIYLILCCTDDSTIRIISSFCMKRKILLYILGAENKNGNKNTAVFSSEEPMMFRLTTCIASQYRSYGDQAIQMNEEGKARTYFQQGIDMQQKLVTYLKKRRMKSVGNQNDTDGIQRLDRRSDSLSSKSLILPTES